jgi:hypothetical protein
MSEDHRGTADRVDDSVRILGFPLRCVRRSMAAVAPSATIIGDTPCRSASANAAASGPAASAVDSAPPTKTPLRIRPTGTFVSGGCPCQLDAEASPAGPVLSSFPLQAAKTNGSETAF